ncbi:MAG: High-affinity zinc uptake system ATP-binding protein ZnuC [Fimbriimonadaceae bacterium]|nr:High-affinity zinc uptake system ATP-binding protein ZnuC [Fimbriimonadaceae bacterium]
MTACTVRDLVVAYGDHIVLDKIDADFRAGSLTAIVGPNGAGKSTLIKAILGLVPKLTGTVEVFGEKFDGFHRRVAYVPQRESVDWDFPVSALDVVMMGTYGRIGWFKKPTRAEIDSAKSAIHKMGLDGLERRQIGRLSGGQQQRVFLARALAQQADLYFMDEPLVGIDAATEQVILDIFRELKAAGKTVVAVHHDLQTVADDFDNALLINRSVVAEGPVGESLSADHLAAAYGRRMAAS